MRWKYVIVEFNGFSTPFVFPELPDHFDVAHALANSHKGGGKIVSAGFCWYDHDKNTWNVYGRSTSLKMESRTEGDVKIFNQMFRTM